VLGGPHVVRGPDVAQACFKRYFFVFSFQKIRSSSSILNVILEIDQSTEDDKNIHPIKE
jgi:hypothetical protein